MYPVLTHPLTYKVYFIIIQYIICRSSCQIYLQTYIYSIQHFRGDQGLKIAYRILNDIKTSPKAD
jgi:hypothetical protein